MFVVKDSASSKLDIRDWTISQALSDLGQAAAQYERKGYVPKIQKPLKGEVVRVSYFKDDEQVILTIAVDANTITEILTLNEAKKYGL